MGGLLNVCGPRRRVGGLDEEIDGALAEYANRLDAAGSADPRVCQWLQPFAGVRALADFGSGSRRVERSRGSDAVRSVR